MSAWEENKREQADLVRKRGCDLLRVQRLFPFLVFSLSFLVFSPFPSLLFSGCYFWSSRCVFNFEIIFTSYLFV